MSQEKVKIDHLGFGEEELFSIQPHSDEEAERITAPRYSYWKSVFRVFFRKKINIIVLIILAVVIGALIDLLQKKVTPRDLRKEVCR